MTKTRAQIVELFKTLPQHDQQELVQYLHKHANEGSFLDRMSNAQLAQLDKALGEADREEGMPAEEFFAQLAKKYGLARAA
jgi:hypothetical protein